MNSERWRLVERLYHAALERQPEQRGTFLAEACGGDTDLRREVESLLAQDGAENGPLDLPVWEREARLLAEVSGICLEQGSQLGPYRVEALIGAGGMGQVFRARDKRLDRLVAIKVLSPVKITDDEQKRRFMLEARASSGLNHPNIITIHEISSENGTHFIVMEYVRGKTLDQLIPSRGMRLNEALRIAIPIADALAAAHAAGIIHRDLKPSNIMMTEQGIVKLLDFGLAKLVKPLVNLDGEEPRGSSAESKLQTQEGLVAGTISYMSPEQAEGRPLDARSDIFSFGTVLYELVTGQRPFHGDSQISTLSAILRDEPKPPSSLRLSVPRDLEKIIVRCLRKDLNRRFQTISDVKIELEELREESESGMRLAEAPVRRRRSVWTYAAAAIAFLGIAGVIWWRRHSVPLPLPSQPVPLTFYLGLQDSPDFSPDGSEVVFVWNGEKRGQNHIYVKPIGSANYLQLTKGDAQENYPKWSPDGQWIAFQRKDSAGVYTFLMSPIGGNERKLHDGDCWGLSWSSDSKALACASPSGLILVSVETGETRQLTSVAKGQLAVLPEFSPDGHSLLFEGGKQGDFDLFLLTLNDNLLPRGSARQITAEHAGTDVLSRVTWMPDGRDAIWAMSKALIYGATLFRVPIFEKRSIQPLAFVGRNVFAPVVARRQNRLVYVRRLFGIDIWRANGHTAERHPVSSTELEWNSQFSPDGKRIAFESNRSGPQEVWVANNDGTDLVQLTNFDRHCGSPRWSPDGRWIVFDALMGGGGRDIWVIERSGGKPQRLTSDLSANSFAPSFSSDGKWIYVSNARTGRSEIFRVPFGGGAAIQLTHSGGEAPQQAVDGQTIYYVGPKSVLHEVSFAGTDEHPLGIEVAARAFQVMPDGIYFIPPATKNSSGREIRFYEFATRQTRLIQSLGRIGIFFGLSVSPDGNTFLYSVSQNNGENLMLVENFR